ncbi:MAG: NUDIX hydrolase [Nocardiopsaceae bacterium]|nr:NUDIX hydrolase [Nocardiopsaceae bacterium]
MPRDPAGEPGEGKVIRAAGAVAWRPGSGGAVEILLVHRARYDDWSLPKGKSAPGEPLPVTAVREVFEESGARITLGRRLSGVRYKVNGHPKRVSYWAARVTGIADGAVPNDEVDAIAWLPAEAAAARVSYSRDREVLDDFAAAPADTLPLILLRHAKAEPKRDWPDDDAARPLSGKGRHDAAALASLLACFAPRAEVLTSPAVRCEQTVRPYAEATGAEVRLASALSISRTGSRDCRALLASVLASGRPTILCAHRENLPGLIAGAVVELGVRGYPPGSTARRPRMQSGGTEVPPSRCADPLPTAGFCAVHALAGEYGAAGEGGAMGGLAAADRYDLPETLLPARVRGGVRAGSPASAA